MADFVRYRMERMTEELDDLEQRGLFSAAEISEIVRRRGDFEHRLKRPCPLKQDFLDYIDYEKHLDALRALRKKAIVGKLRRKREEEEEGEDGDGKRKKKKGKKGTKWRSDVAGVLRILDIYRLATTRYKGDLGLWFQYLEFCRVRRNGVMKKVLAQAIRYHPKVPGLWIYAAAWEFDENLNVAAARALMQSGLRSCPESEDLWIEYLRMELTYLNKLKARKVALGEDVKTLQRNNQDDERWEKENKDLFMSLDEENEGIEKSDTQKGSLEETEDIIWQQGALVLQVVYQGAIKALPSSMNLRQRFLEILNSVDLAHSDELKVDILEDLKKDFSDNENYWDWMARLQITEIAGKDDSDQGVVVSKLDKVVQVYEEAVKVVPTAKMFSLYAQFWQELVTPGEGLTSFQNKIDLDVLDISSYVLNVYKKSEHNGCLTEELACQYVSFLMQTGKLEEAQNVAKELCNGKLSEAPNLWILRASMEIESLTNKSASLNKDALSSAFKLLRNPLTKLSIAKIEKLWLMAMKLFSNDREYFDKLMNALILALGRDGGSESGGLISSAVVNWFLQRDGIKRARDIYKQFLALPRPSIKIFKHCIDLESNLGFTGDKSGITNARKVYESALAIHTQNRELWKDYYLMETKIGTSETVNAVYSRARKVLNDATALLIPSKL